MTIKIRSALSKEDKIKWDTYVSSHPDAIAYQLFAWKEAVEKAYGFKGHYLMAAKNDLICGVLPLITVKIPFLGSKMVSLPYCDAGGLLADSSQIAQELLQSAFMLADKNRSKHVNIRSIRPFASIQEELTCNPNKVRMILDLPENSELLMKLFKSKLRSQVKKPMKDGLILNSGHLEFLDDFYDLFAENMRDLGSPVHAKKWFENILAQYGENSRLFLVKMPDGTPAAGGILLFDSKTVSVPWASSLRKYNRSNPNMLLYWGFLEFASNNGFSYFDFGRSTPNEGTYRFKKQWGACPKPLHWVDFEPTGDATVKFLPILEREGSAQSSSLRQIVEKIICKTPVGISTFIGKMTRKYITL